MKKKEKSSSVFDIVIILLFVFVVTVTMKAVICKAKGKINYIFGKYAVLYVVSGSMEPVISTDSYILIKKADASDIRVDTVISFISDDPEIEGAVNTHRVIEILDNGEFVTKGDSSASKDPVTAKPGKLVGEYVGNMTLLTVLGNAFASKAGAVVVFGFLGATMIIAIIRVVLAAYLNKNENSNENDNGKKEEKQDEKQDETSD